MLLTNDKFRIKTQKQKDRKNMRNKGIVSESQFFKSRKRAGSSDSKRSK